MRKLVVLLLALSLQSCILFEGNWSGEPASPESDYTAIFMNRNAFESAVTVQTHSAIGHAGKIYTFNGKLYINDTYKGFHLFDNTDPANPIGLKFINCPGATDMAIKNNSIYINQATDLIAIELSADMQSLVVTKRIENVFPQMVSPDGFWEETPEGQVLVEWVLNE